VKLDRRALLKSSLWLPLLPSLARGATPAPLRFVFIMNRNGQMEENFYPNVPGTQQQAGLWSTPLSGISGPLSAIFHSGWDAHRPKMSILRGLDITAAAAGHCRSSFLCGVGVINDTMEYQPPRYGASIDWLLERSSAFYPAAPRLKAIRFSVSPGRGFSFSNLNGTVASLSYLDTDTGVFNNAFGSFTGGGPVTVSPEARRTFLIDKALERFSGLQQNRRLGSADRTRLDQHAQQLTQLKASLTVPTPAMCSAPTQSGYQSGDPLRKKYENVNDTIVAAFTCDLTRIAAIYCEDFDDSNTDYSYFHGLSHVDPSTDANAVAKSAAHNRWIGDRVLHLVDRLASTVDVDGRSMLDNTVVMWGNEQSNYWHRSESIPTVVIGGTSKLNQGYYLDYRQRPFRYYANRGDFPAVGRPYTQLLCTLMRAGGLQPSDYAPFGDGGKFGEWTQGTYDAGEYTAFAATRNDPLPFFAV
jgi:hypothetical protein